MESSLDLARLREELSNVAAREDPTERLLEVAALIGEAVADLRLRPVIVGGLAIAYWSDREFVTGDIDVVMPRPAELSKRLEALGFVKEGREWTLPPYDVAIEVPAETLEPGDEAESIALPSGRSVLVLSLVDVLLWRLREWVHWHSAAGFKQAASLLVTEHLQAERLDRRAAEEGLTTALSALRALTAAIEGGRRYEDWELAERAQEVTSGGYSQSDE